MDTRISGAATALLTAQAACVGCWAGLFPRALYDSFPGPGRHWVSSDGPYDAHLVRDVGSLYLALAVAGVLALARRDHGSGSVVGSAWTIFAVLHLGYHLMHLDELSRAVDRVGETVALAGNAVLALLVLDSTSCAVPAAPAQAAR